VTLTAVALVAFLVPGSKSRPVAWRAFSVGPLQITYQQRRLFRDRKQLETFLTRTGAKRTPKIDFSSRQLLLLSTGARSSSGYGLDVLSATEKEGGITVEVRERSPGIAEHVDPRVTYPYRLISLPAGKEVFVDWIGR
jgi:PrcB C-terminal